MSRRVFQWRSHDQIPRNPPVEASRLQREEHRKDGGRIPQHGETCRGGGDDGQDRLDTCREHGRRDNREHALLGQETGAAELW